MLGLTEGQGELCDKLRKTKTELFRKFTKNKVLEYLQYCEFS